MYEKSAVQADLQHLLVLRVFATFLVVFGHAASFFGAFTWTQWPQLPYIQSTAVILFFCISGYTIAWVCDTNPVRDWAGLKSFAFDRYVRLAVPLIPALVLFGIADATWIWQWSPYNASLTLWDALGNALFLQNMSVHSPYGAWSFNVEPLGTNRPLWTLSLEFWIYVLFGALHALVFSRDPRGSGLLVLVGLLSAIFVAPWFLTGHGAGLPMVWFFGAFVYLAQRRIGTLSPWFRVLTGAAAAICIAALAYPPLWSMPEYGTEYLVLVPLAFACLMLCFLRVQLPVHALRAVSFLGGFCYTVYLTHYPIQFVAARFLPPSATSVVIVTVACFAFGWLFSLPFEAQYKQIRAALRQRLFPARVVHG